MLRRGRLTNPVAIVAAARCERSPALAAWVLLPVPIAAAAAIWLVGRPPLATPILRSVLMERVSSPTPGETFALALLLVGYILLTVVGTIPRATFAVARQREQRPLEALLLTRLSGAAILFGALVQATLPPLLGTLALLPLLCLAFAMGGIEVGAILSSFGMLLICQITLACTCLSFSCRLRRSTVAIALGYAWLVCLHGGTVALWFAYRVPGGANPWWLESLLGFNPIAALANTVMPHKDVLFGDVTIPFAGSSVLVQSLSAAVCFIAGIAALRRR